jgi:uroporphyrinogen decarboxylase
VDRKEFIKRVLRGEHSRRLPRALFGAGLWAYRQTGLKIEDIVKDPAHFAGTLAAFFKELDTDIVFPGSGLNAFPAEAIGGHLAFRGAMSPLLSFPVIEKTEDARYLEAVNIAGSPYTQALVEMISLLRKLLPDRYFCATSWGPYTWAMILCDWNVLKDKTASDRVFIEEVCELGVRLSFAFFKPLMEQGLIDGISIPEGAVTLIPVDLYREAVLPRERNLFQQVKEFGLGCFLHQCGDISSQIALYPETGADCISVDVGVPIGEIYELYHERVVTAGNVDVINSIFGGRPDLLCKSVSDCVAGISDPHKRYILMPSCDLPPETPLCNVRKFLECADQFTVEEPLSSRLVE